MAELSKKLQNVPKNLAIEDDCFTEYFSMQYYRNGRTFQRCLLPSSTGKLPAKYRTISKISRHNIEKKIFILAAVRTLSKPQYYVGVTINLCN
jgi:hypothetical protein